MICKNCGKELKEGAVFCSECGSPVEDSNSYEDSNSSGLEGNQTNYSGVPAKTKKNNKTLIIVIIAVAVVAVVGVALFFLVSNLNATKELKAAVDAKNLNLVDTVYSEALGNESKLKKYDSVIADMINDIKTDLDSQNFDEAAKSKGYEAVKEYLSGQWGITLKYEYTPTYISQTNSSAWSDLVSLAGSKANYCEGIYDKTEGNYVLAISNFSGVIEGDASFESATAMTSECVDLYINDVLSSADEYIADDDIFSALDVLAYAMSELDECSSYSEAIQTKISETLSTNASNYAAKAEEAFKKHDVDAAIGKISVAMNLVPDNADYDSKYSYYQQFIPFELYDEDNVLNEEDNDDFWGMLVYNYLTDANDNEEKDCSLVWYNNNDVMASMGVNYNLEGKYDTVTGEIFLSQYYRDTDANGYFEAYGDGELIYTSPNMTAGVLPEDISFSVSGVYTLQLRFYSKCGSGYWDTSAEFGVNNMVAQKNFPE